MKMIIMIWVNINTLSYQLNIIAVTRWHMFPRTENDILACCIFASQPQKIQQPIDGCHWRCAAACNRIGHFALTLAFNGTEASNVLRVWGDNLIATSFTVALHSLSLSVCCAHVFGGWFTWVYIKMQTFALYIWSDFETR